MRVDFKTLPQPEKTVPAHSSTEHGRCSLLLSFFFPCLCQALEEQCYLVSVQQEVMARAVGGAEASIRKEKKYADRLSFWDRRLVGIGSDWQLWLPLMCSLWIMNQTGHRNYGIEMVSRSEVKKRIFGVVLLSLRRYMSMRPQRGFPTEVTGGKCLLFLPLRPPLTIAFGWGIRVS